MLSTQKQASLALLSITLFWGITFPLIRIAVQTLNPVQFVLVRFGVALALLTPLVIRKFLQTVGPFSNRLKAVTNHFYTGMGLGVIVWVSYQSQTLGLQTVESGRAAFITGTSVILIPLISPFLGLGIPKRIDFLAATGALLGLYFLTNPSSQEISVGDLWIALCAIFYAIYVLCIQLWVKKDADAIILSFYQILGVFLCSLLLHWVSGQSLPVIQPSAQLSIGICALFATVLTTVLQTRFQPQVSAEKAALIFSFESVFASFFGYLLLGEVLSRQGILGCSLIFASIVGSEVLKARMNSKPLSRTA